MDRVTILETLAARVGNSFLKNENSFQQVMKQRVLLERIFNQKSYEQNRKSRNLPQESEILFLKNEDSFWQAKQQKVLLERIFNCRSYDKNHNFRIHQIRGRISYNQDFIQLTSVASNFDSYRQIIILVVLLKKGYFFAHRKL